MVKVRAASVRNQGMGVHEDNFAPYSGLRQKSFSFLTSGSTAFPSQGECVAYNVALTTPGDQTWRYVDAASAGWRNSNLPFPCTPAIQIEVAGSGTTTAMTMQLEITGRDGFGQQISYKTPILVFGGSAGIEVRHLFWPAQVFSRIDKVSYWCPTALGGAATLSLGVKFTWDPSITSETISDPADKLFTYCFPLNQGIGSQLKIQGTHDYDQVTMQIIRGAAGPTTIAEVPPFGSIANHGGLQLGSVGTAGATDVITGRPYDEWQKDQHKIRIHATAGLPIRCQDLSTAFVFRTAGGVANPSVMSAIDYRVRVFTSVGVRPARRSSTFLGG